MGQMLLDGLLKLAWLSCLGHEAGLIESCLWCPQGGVLSICSE